jgi:hypothetical protein
VANQVLLKVGEVRGRRGPDRQHPFGRGQEKYFWALVSAVSVFFIGCGVNVYHGFHALLNPEPGGAFSPLVISLLLFSLALEAWTFRIAWKEIGGLRGLADNRHDTTVIAVLLEDTVALLGILLTLLVAGIGYAYGPHPEFDAGVAIAVPKRRRISRSKFASFRNHALRVNRGGGLLAGSASSAGRSPGSGRNQKSRISTARSSGIGYLSGRRRGRLRETSSRSRRRACRRWPADAP